LADVQAVPLPPTDVLGGSRQPFWWICAAGHAWRASDRPSLGHQRKQIRVGIVVVLDSPSRPAALYDYRDELGEIVFQVVRGPSKRFGSDDQMLKADGRLDLGVRRGGAFVPL
jgi:hypothetical protein